MDTTHDPARRVAFAAGGVLLVTLVALGAAAWSLLGVQARRTEQRATIAASVAARAFLSALARADAASPQDRVLLGSDWKPIDPRPPRAFEPTPAAADEAGLFFVRVAEEFAPGDGGGPASPRAALRLAATSKDPATRLRAAAAGVRLEIREGTGDGERWSREVELPAAFAGTREGVLIGLAAGEVASQERALLAIGSPDEDEAAALLVGLAGPQLHAAVADRRSRLALADVLRRDLRGRPDRIGDDGRKRRVVIRDDGSAATAVSAASGGWSAVQIERGRVQGIAAEVLESWGAQLVDRSAVEEGWATYVLPAPSTLAVAAPMDRAGSGMQAGVVLTGLAVAATVALLAFVAFVRAVLREGRLTALRTEFVATVGHELRTPVAVIRTCAETLVLGRVEQEADRRSFLEAIVRESEKLAGLLGNVLDFARMEAGSRTYRFERADVGQVVREAVDAHRAALARVGFEVELGIDTDLPRVECDAEALRASVTNLLENATKFSPERRDVQVRVRKEGDGVAVEVVDHGMGVPDSEKRRVFDRFFRGGSADVQETRGTGIGLALVRGAAQAHGGDVVVVDTPGGGATFRVTLPSRQEEG